MNNSVYGKTLKNVRDRMNIKLVNDSKKLLKAIAKPSFHAYKVFNPDLVGVHSKKNSIKLNRPIYTGFSILEISKTLIYRFHYDSILKKYPQKVSLLFTDTDSLCYEIYTDDIYDDLIRDSHEYDTSDYPSTHKSFNLKNKKVLGKMKDEMAGEPIVEFVGLRSKMYSILINTHEGKKRAKGVQKQIVKNLLKHEDYKNVLFYEDIIIASAKKIASLNHHLYTVNERKVALSAYDDKRYVLENKYDSPP